MKRAIKFLAFWAALILVAIINLEIIKNGGFCLTDTFLEGGWSYCRDVAKDSWPNMSYGFIYIYLLLTVFSGVGMFGLIPFMQCFMTTNRKPWEEVKSYTRSLSCS